MSEPVEAEVIETHPAVVPSSEQAVTLFGTANPVEVIERATELAKPLASLIEERELYTDIRGRRHVRVEGWTLLGSMLGVFPIAVWSRELPADSQGKPSGWEARVEARTRAGEVVGAAEAECRYAEEIWEDRDSYALRSMAQTRATSKALRLPLGFVMQLAGFSATPAEEMPAGGGRAPVSETSFKCPECGSKVWDNRGEHDKRQGNAPVFKCSNKKCTGGGLKDKDKPDGARWPWGTWDAHYFEGYENTLTEAVAKLTEGDLEKANELVVQAAAELGIEFEQLDNPGETPSDLIAARDAAATIYSHVREVMLELEPIVSDDDPYGGGGYG